MSVIRRRHRVLLATLLGLAVPLTVAPGAPALPISADEVTSLPTPVYVAHRGGAMEARENSLSGLQSALDSGAVQVLELDTRLTSDGTVVVMHDSTVDRTSQQKGPVSSYSSATWTQVMLDIGSWLVPRPEPERAPTLAAVLDAFGGQIMLSVEAKDPAAVDAIAGLVKSRGLVGSVYVDTNDPSVAQKIHAKGLSTELWRSADQMRGDDPADFTGFVDLLDVDIEATDADITRFVTAGATAGVPVWTHTLTTRAERNRALSLGVRGFVTDDPRYLTGRTDTYPMPPTKIRLLGRPHPTQVSDRTTLRCEVTQEAGPDNPEAVPRVTGRSVTSSSTVDNRGVRTVVLSTTGAEAGSGDVALSVAAGHGNERRWTAGSRAVSTLR